MKNLSVIWDRLTTLARCGNSAEESVAIPPGFATRVVAHWMEIRRGQLGPSMWEWLAVRGFAVALVVMVVSAVAAWPESPSEPPAAEAFADLADPITPELLPPL